MNKNFAARYLRNKLNLSLLAIIMVAPVSGSENKLYEIVRNDAALLEKQAKSVLSFSASEIYGAAEMVNVLATQTFSTPAADKKTTYFIVMGEVNCPGEFEVIGKANLLAAVLAAGGPRVSGSMRRVEVFAAGKLLGEFDLYDLLPSSRSENEFVLSGGESVLVHLAGPRARISGAVKRPAVYEFKPGEMTLRQAVRLAGGFADSEAVHKLEVLRFSNGLRRVLFSMETVADEKILEFPILPDDEISVMDLKVGRQKYVTLEGLENPLRIVCGDGLKLSDVLSKPSDYSKIALEYAEILRESSAGSEYEVLGFSPAAVIAGDEKRDVLLRPGDRIVLFDREWLGKVKPVSIEGMVCKPATVTFQPEMTVKSVIQECGGVSKKNLSKADLFRRKIVNGQLEFSHIAINLKLALENDPRHNLKLQPFDSLFIGGSDGD